MKPTTPSRAGEPTTPFRTRPPVKQDAIVEHLRQRIVHGELAPGARLPPRAAIERRFKASPVTVQRALERLVDDGFVSVAGPLGTFVAEFPPHLHRYALVFPAKRHSPRWMRFWSLLVQEAATFSLGLPTPIELYTGVEPGVDDGEIARLTDDLAAHRLSGVIFACDPWPLLGTAILDQPDMPRVAFASNAGNTPVPGVSLGGDGVLFFRRAVDYLVARGRTRIALLTVPGLSGAHLDCYRSILAERGLAYQPWCVQVGMQEEPQWSAHLTMLMFRSAAHERPDGLIIADDHLVDHACTGLIRQGMRLPEDVDVVAHANFPVHGTDIAPIARLGYDIPKVFSTCVELLVRQRTAAVAASTLVAPRFSTPACERLADSASLIAPTVAETLP